MSDRMSRLIFLTLFLGIRYLDVAIAARKATPCNNRRPLLDDETSNLEVPFHLLFHNNPNRITSSSSIPNHSPSEARMSGNGWCAHSSFGPESHYLHVDFGAEVVVEALVINTVHDNSSYVTKYYVAYGSDTNEFQYAISADSNGVIFDGVDVCKRNSDAEMKNFSHPIVARFIRVVPLEWADVSPCLRLELYGCYIKECSQIQDISNNANLLPTENIKFSTYASPSHTNISNAWCSNLSDTSPNVNFTFTKRLHLLYAVVRGINDDYFVSNFSLTYKNPSGKSVIYTNVDGISFHRLHSPNDSLLLLWTSIVTNRIQLNVHNKSNTFRCIGIQFYGCRSNKVINHVSDEASVKEVAMDTANPTSCAVSPTQQTSVITVTTTDIQTLTTTSIQLLTTTVTDVEVSTTTVTDVQVSSTTVTNIEVSTTTITDVQVSTTTTVEVSTITRSITMPASTTTSSVTLTTTTTATSTTTTTTTSVLQPSCSCSDQPKISASSSSNSDTITASTTVHTLATTVHTPATTRAIVKPTSTITSHITLPTTTTTQSSCSCSDQRQPSASSTNDFDSVTIGVSAVLVIVVIISFILVIIGILILRKIQRRNDVPHLDKFAPRTTLLVDNDIYGMDSRPSKPPTNKNEDTDTGARVNKMDLGHYEYPTEIEPTNQSKAICHYETVSLYNEDAGTKTNIYSEN